ncbi:hypothetical protein NDU88_006433 [Pleurodeles waltl]|uniref:Uncharacterized protein n=1 Tax=Pleurodeles waltl TaxID=8319 RepID=A0AAV7NQ88_PLEWA|nr:hypothetical protein NDU88_006433 [Pleurodeles waltl]
MHRSESCYCFTGLLEEELSSCLLLPVPARYILNAGLRGIELHGYLSHGDAPHWMQCRLGTTQGLSPPEYMKSLALQHIFDAWADGIVMTSLEPRPPPALRS